jgi:outer membrane biosynthesis protein TonB
MQKKRRKGGLMSLLALVMVLSMVASTVAFAEPDDGDTAGTAVATEQESSDKDDDGAEEVDLQKLIIALSAPEVEKEKDEEPEEVTAPHTEAPEPAEDEDTQPAETEERVEPVVETEPQTEKAEDEEPAAEPATRPQATVNRDEDRQTQQTQRNESRSTETEAAPAEEAPETEAPTAAPETEAPTEEATKPETLGVGFVPASVAAKTNLTVKCGWIDSQDQDGMRPGTVYMTIYANGVPVKVVCVTEDDGWQLKITDLNEYDADGNRIQYSVSCSTVKGYLTKIVGCIAYHFRAPEKIDVCGTKVWDDSDNADGIRPASIIVRLYAFGKYVTSRTVTSETGWRYCFKDCPKYCYGTLIDYSISEDSIDGYTTAINGFDIINTHVPETTAPVETTPEETTAPVETTPEETTAPEETTPVETTPEETTAPEETTPVETTPEETTAPEETTPVETTPEETTPVETTPVETTPEETTPVETTPEETTPVETTAPDETTPGVSETNPPDETVTETTTAEETTVAPTQPSTKTPNKPTNPGKSVKTGDNTKMVIWFAVMVVSVAAIATVLVLRRRRG